MSIERDITPEQKEHIKGDTTTLATCWKLTRPDGVSFGFTNYDDILFIDGLEYSPSITAEMSSIEQSADTSISDMNIQIVFDSEYITKEDINKGLFDNSSLEIFMVNHNDLSQGKIKLISGILGRVEIKEHGGNVEFRSLAQYLKQAIGRIYSYKCDTQFADDRCGINIHDYTYSGEISSVIDRANFVDDSRTEADGYFKYGRITVISGENEGYSMEVKSYGNSGEFELFRPMPYNLNSGEVYEVTAGCDKFPSTCKNKFNNFINFRGFPHLPGRDEIMKYPNQK